MRPTLLFALALLAAGCDAQTAAPANAQSVRFPALTGRVVDRADLLSPEHERRIEAASAAVEREVGPQFVVATVDSLEGRPIEEYGVDLGRHWGVGRRGHNDGVILLVAPNERRVRIEVGTGLERRVTDPFASEVLRRFALPRFRQGDMAGGILAASDAIVSRLRSPKTDAQLAAEDGLVL
ncbi:MAG TPA: TPM domain-containing protein [Allosphingosinicella sp.]|nr:TPM domain-containing protein [Allosphingosinicella sp.]HYG29853.1 TPM domain-containing protein [Allosphingosinicella sp.]